MDKKLIVFIFFAKIIFLSVTYSQVVVINEVCTSPPGVNGTNSNSLYNTSSAYQPPDNQEWIELYNPNPCNSVNIGCYTLAGNMLQTAGNTSTPNWGAFTFPAGTVIPPRGFIVVGGNHAQVPILEFNLNYYRQNTFGVQYLDGDPVRWFLRDEYGWIALYNTAGTPVDAVYWDAYGNASNLFTAGEYQENVVTRTTCNGTKTLASARNINGIKYLGACIPSSYLSFQRAMDGSSIWKNGPVTPTPHACNGPCVVPPKLNFVIQNESCAGSDGSIAMTITDGHSGPYTTNWLNPAGVHTNSITNLSAGVYIVQVADAFNCITSDTVTITKALAPTISFTNIIDETCDLNNGSVKAVVVNGNLPISYVWNTISALNTAQINNLNAGTYSLSITDNLGCTASNSITIMDYPGPQLFIDSISNEMCNSSNGAVFIQVLGGTAPFTYLWNSSPVQQNQNLNGVPAGNYSVIVTDANGCKAFSDTSLTNTPPPIIVFENIRYDTCNKRTGYISVKVTGGHPPYYISWSNDSSLINQDFISHLSQGNYTVYVTDNFCVTAATIYIENIPGPQADFNLFPPVATIDDPSFRFENLSSGIIDRWSWDFGDMSYSIVEDPYYTYTAVGAYNVILKIANDYGCVDSIIKVANVVDIPALYVPNCFTPNGDGINDYFAVGSTNISDYTLYLYNRWGELIYTSHNINDQWDGKYKGSIVTEDIYTWVIFYKEEYAGIMTLPQTRTGFLMVFL